MMGKSVLAVAIFAVALSASGAMADSITYDINEPVGAGGIMGTITTDGTVGMLATADIIDWSLNVSDGTNTFNLNPGVSHAYVTGSDLTASPTQLLFNFSDSNPGYLFFQSPAIGNNGPYACFISNSKDCFEASSVVFDPTFGTDGPSNPNLAMAGDAVIGTAAVPEPITLSIFGVGLAGLGAMRRRKTAKA